MSEASELIAQQILNASINKKNWGQVLYNVKVFGAQGDGIYDDTQAVQDAIDTALFNGATLVYFPPGTYKVTSLSNTETINFVGDNASFVGYDGTITQFGISTGQYDIRSYGATGDGITDDSVAIQAAIDACPIGGQVYIPTPDVYYKCSTSLEIIKPISIIGDGAIYPFALTGQMIQFDTSCITGFHIRSYDVRIDGISILMKLTTGLPKGIYLETVDDDPDGFMRNIHISNVNIMLSGAVGTGVRGVSVITSSFTNVKCHQGNYGFNFDSTYGVGTSVKFDSCWAINSVTGGYKLDSYLYSTFINCAADTVNGAPYAYTLNACQNISFIGCGAEQFARSGYSITSSSCVVLNGCLVTAISAPNFSTFAELRGTTNKVVMIGCSDLSVSALANVLIEAVTAENPTIINCNFPYGYSTDGAQHPAPTNKGYLQLGSTFLTDDGIIPGSITALPAASATYRGRIMRIEGGGGVADTLNICLKAAGGTYSWKVIETG